MTTPYETNTTKITAYITDRQKRNLDAAAAKLGLSAAAFIRMAVIKLSEAEGCK